MVQNEVIKYTALNADLRVSIETVIGELIECRKKKKKEVKNL